MIKWLICYVWGHKNIIKSYTGKTFDTYHKLYPHITVKGLFYRYEKKDFCLRCGKKLGE